MIRDARIADLPRIVAITNEAILHGTALWSITPVTLEQREAWMTERLAAGFPVLVAERGAAVVGFGSFGAFRPHEGYRNTVEHSLYVDPGSRRTGVGSAMLAELVRRARAAGLHAMVGALEAGNAASRALHRSQGFREAALLPEVGRKFGRWLDLLFVVLMLEEGEAQ